jgi:hypothetical protein
MWCLETLVLIMHLAARMGSRDCICQGSTNSAALLDVN